MRFTDKSLAALKPKPSRYDVTETGVSPDRRGLLVRVFPNGTRTFRARYTFAGKQQVLTIGHYPKTSLKEAHDRLAEIRGMVEAGQNPKGDAPVQTAGFTLQQVAEEWRDKYLKVRAKTWEETWRRLKKDVLPTLGERRADEIKPREVVLLIDGIMQRGSPVVANKIRGDLAQMYRFAVSRALVESSPVVAIEKPHREAPRNRKLTDAEIRKVWRKLGDAKMLPMMRHALRLLLVTGQRSGELRRATWSEFDFRGKLWTIPAEHIKKSHRDELHEVPLSPLALDVLRELRASLGDYNGPLVLPSPHRKKNQSIEARALAHAIRNNREHLGVDPFTPHDFRRTVRSGLAALGVNPVVARRVVNHTLAGMDAVYDRHDYAVEKRLALELWADHLQAIIVGKRPKVAPLRRATA